MTTSDSISSFLDLARSQRLLPADQVENLFRQPDVPQSDLAALCEFLRQRGVLTAYQAGMIRSGRGIELNFAGYPIVDELGPCPGGMAYKALHPSLRSPVILRRLRTSWLAPADNAAAYVLRAQAACPVSHPHVVPLLDAGAYRDELFVVLEPDEGSDLQQLVADIGAMPANLAAEYGRQAAIALQVIHDRCLVHGHVRPNCLRVGPLVPTSKPRPDGTPRMRPAATARVKLAELGLEPFRPSLAAGLIDPTATVDLAQGLAFLPPERVKDPDRSPAGDVYGLGMSLYYLLTGKAPYTAERCGELLDQIETGEPVALHLLRPDCPPLLTDAIRRMTARDPSARLSSAEVVEQLTEVIAAARPPASIETTPTTRMPVATGPGPHIEVDFGTVPTNPPASAPVPIPAPAYAPPPGGWVAMPYQPAAYGSQLPGAAPPWEGSAVPAHPDGFDHTHTHDDTPLRPRPDSTKGRNWVLWLIAGAVLNIVAIVGWIFLFSGLSDSKPTPKPPVKRTR